MPILPPKPFWQSDDKRVRVFCGDCRQILPRLGKYAFVFADPPFNIGQDYNGYQDRIAPGEYKTWTLRWAALCWESCAGVLALHGPDTLTRLYLELEPVLGLSAIAWINWHYRFGQCTRGNWIDARCHCLLYSHTQEHTWNPEEVLVDSDRVAYGDKRINETERGGKRLPGTVWGVPSDGPYWGRVQGNSIERRPGHPNQLPEVYLERLLRAYTNPGDLVLDPFGGSGTTAVVGDALGRSCDTIEISEESCRSIVERVKQGAVRIGLGSKQVSHI